MTLFSRSSHQTYHTSRQTFTNLDFRMSNNTTTNFHSSSIDSIDSLPTIIPELNFLLSHTNMLPQYQHLQSYFAIYNINFYEIITQFSHISSSILQRYKQSPTFIIFKPHSLDENIYINNPSKITLHDNISDYIDNFWHIYHTIIFISKQLYDNTPDLINIINTLQLQFFTFINTQSITITNVNHINQLIHEYYAP